MEKFVALQSRVVPLPAPNIDTDVIVRINRLTQHTRAELGPWAFEALRYLPDRSLNPDCTLNQPRFAGAQILVAGDNFGCGSSREGAVWAMLGMGLRCVISPRFGDIFYSNCFQNGLLPIRLAPDTVAALGEQALHFDLMLEVDLAAQEVRGAEGGAIRFEIEPLRRMLLLEGLDEIGLSLTRLAEVDAFQARDRSRRPWIYPGPAANASEIRP